jgi:hypothetical protein
MGQGREQDEYQQRVECVENDVRRVVTARIESVELAVQHV